MPQERTAPSIENLRAQVARIPRDCFDIAARRPENMQSAGAAPATSFGAWLLAQVDRGDDIDGLAKSARSDPGFPKSGTPEQVRAHLRKLQADGDVFALIDYAELDWASL